jgi:hypothetical protein
MDSRQKFHAVMTYDDRSINMKTEFGFWASTVRKWFVEGLDKIQDSIPEGALDGKIVRASADIEGSEEITDPNTLRYFDLDSYPAKFPFDLSPMFEKRTIDENDDYLIFKDNYGLTQKVIKKGAATPQVIDYPIKSRADLYKYFDNYDYDFSKRLPKDWEGLCRKLKTRDFPIRLGGGPYGFSFMPRFLMGEVGYMMSMYDDPKLIDDLNEFYIGFVMQYWDIILKNVDVDCIFILEDIAYRAGSFISKEMFERFMSPYYVRFVDFLKQYDVGNIFVDCDGLVDELIPLWMDAGVNGIFPVEAVNDLAGIRRNYPGLKLMGGFDKKILFKDSEKSLIDEKLKETEDLIKKGRYIPHIDHAVSEDVTWDNFKYYRFRLNEIIEKL